jgi:alanine dehydrogenase
MIVGVPKEIKEDEYRVAIVPSMAQSLVEAGHGVVLERGAGLGSGISDEAYADRGVKIVSSAEVWASADLILKVKELQPSEWGRVRKGQMLFLFFHFASSRDLVEAMIHSGATCFAMETVENDEGAPVLLTPMSEIAGRLSVIEGAKHLETPLGGRGVLLSGLPGVPPAHVLILGGGTVGAGAARAAAALGARVTLFDVNLQRLRELSDFLPSNFATLYASPSNIREQLPGADLVIGAAHRVGGKAPHLLTRRDLALLPKGAVLVDVAIDQGGCFETSHPTTHSNPTYVVDGIIHYCVANMPGCVARTATLALTNATAPFVKRLASLGFLEAIRRDSALRRGVNIHEGKITHPAVAREFGLRHTPIEEFLLGK